MNRFFIRYLSVMEKAYRYGCGNFVTRNEKRSSIPKLTSFTPFSLIKLMKTTIHRFLNSICILWAIQWCAATSPSAAPTRSPTFAPSQSPTRTPTANPTLSPTARPTLSPTFSPTFSPTAFLNPQGAQAFVTAPIAILNVEYPIAPHQLIVVQPAGNSLIQLSFYHSSTTNVSWRANF